LVAGLDILLSRREGRRGTIGVDMLIAVGSSEPVFGGSFDWSRGGEGRIRGRNGQSGSEENSGRRSREFHCRRELTAEICEKIEMTRSAKGERKKRLGVRRYKRARAKTGIGKRERSTEEGLGETWTRGEYSTSLYDTQMR
jgi:hypothetical protein